MRPDRFPLIRQPHAPPCVGRRCAASSRRPRRRCTGRRSPAGRRGGLPVLLPCGALGGAGECFAVPALRQRAPGGELLPPVLCAIDSFGAMGEFLFAVVRAKEPVNVGRPPSVPTTWSRNTCGVHAVADVSQSDASAAQLGDLGKNLVGALPRPTTPTLGLWSPAHRLPLRMSPRRSLRIFRARSARSGSWWNRATASVAPV